MRSQTFLSHFSILFLFTSDLHRFQRLGAMGKRSLPVGNPRRFGKRTGKQVCPCHPTNRDPIRLRRMGHPSVRSGLRWRGARLGWVAAKTWIMRNFQGEEPPPGLDRAADVAPQRPPAADASVAQHRKQQSVGSGDERGQADVAEHAFQQVPETPNGLTMRGAEEHAVEAQRR